MMNKAEMLDKERKRLMEENEQYKMHVESLKMLINEKTQNGAGASTAATSMVINLSHLILIEGSVCKEYSE